MEEHTHTIESIKNNIIEWANNNLSQNFQFRKYQLESITYIIKSILIDKRQTQIIEAPTGSGKSLISIISAGVLASYYKINSYILCSDVFLWGQYANAINQYHLYDFGYLKGLNNYKCYINKQDVKSGKCKLNKVSYTSLKQPDWCMKHGYSCVQKCQYMIDRFRAEKKPVTLMTYHLWLYHMNIVNNTEHCTFKRREVIFCDECHNIPDIIQSFCTITFNGDRDIQHCMNLIDYATENSLKADCSYVKQIFSKMVKTTYFYNNSEFKPTRDYCFNEIFDADELKKKLTFIYDSLSIMNDFTNEDTKILLENLCDILNVILTVKDSLEDVIKAESFNSNGKLSQEFIKLNNEINWFSNYYTYITEFFEVIKKSGEEYLVLEENENSETHNKEFSFNCAKEDMMCFNKLLKHTKYAILLSATVGMHESFENNIGVKYTSQQTSIMSRIPSTFDFSRSPIYYIPKYKMSVANKNKDFPIIREMIFKILNKHNERGIIHTGSYENALNLFYNTPVSLRNRLILYNGSKEKANVMQTYINNPNAVLIGPTLKEGIDLPDDLCRFNIIMKVPYPNIAGKLTKTKKDLFPLWYDSTTSNDIIQSIGRGVRNEHDYCITYILDGCFTWLYQKTSMQYPADFQQRLRYINY